MDTHHSLNRSCEVCGWPLRDDHPNKTCQKCTAFSMFPVEQYRRTIESFKEYREKNLARTEDSAYMQHVKWFHETQEHKTHDE
jgi:hypothetical protein